MISPGFKQKITKEAKISLYSSLACHAVAWQRRVTRHLSLAACFLLLIVSVAPTAEAGGKKPKPTPTPTPVPGVDAQQTWKNTAGNTDFNTGASWVSGAAPGAGDVGAFAAARVVNPNLSASLSISGLYFKGTGSSGYDVTSSSSAIKFTLTGTATTTGGTETGNSTAAAIGAENTSGTNTIDAPIILAPSSGTTSTFYQANGGTLIVNGDISGAAITLNINGTSGGIIQLAGNNTYSGGTTLQSGIVLNINSATAVGTGTLTFNGSATIDNTTGSAITLTNNNAIALSGGSLTFTGTKDLSFGTGIVTMSGANRSITVTNAGATLTVGGIAQDASTRNFTKLGTGTLVLGGSSTYTGTTTITAGTLQLGSGGTTGSLSTSSAITDNGDFTVNRSNAVLQGTDFSGAAITGSGSFTQAGSGTTTLTATNTYTGATTISGGTLQLGNGGTTGSLTKTTSIVDNANLTINHSDAFTQATDLSSVVISGTGSFTQAGAGTTTLTLANTYAGNTNVNAGTLGIGATDTIPTSSNVTVSGGATLSFTNKNFTQTIGGLSGSGTVTATTGSQNFLTVGNGDASATFSGVIQDGGGHMGLTKTGTGTQILSGTNTYSLATTVNAGTLLVNNTTGSGTGSSAVTVNNSGSVLGGTGTISGSVSIASSGAILEGGTGTTGALQKLTISGALSMSSGSIIELALGAGGAHSTLALTGATASSFATTQHFSFINLGATAGLYDNIITGVTSNPFPTDTFTIDNSGFIGTFSYDSLNQAIDLNLTAIPEPSTLCAAALAFAVVSYTQRKRFARLIARA